MSGLPLTFDPTTVRGPEAQPGDTREAPGNLAQIAAGARVANDAVEVQQDARLSEAYDPLIEALVERGIDRSELYVAPSSLGMLGGFFGGASSESGWDRRKIYRLARERGIEGLPATQEEFEQGVLRRGDGRDRDQDILARGNGVAGFVGGMAGAMSDPVNILSLGVGGVGKTVAQRILIEGAVNAGVEIVQTPSKFDNYERLGEDFTASDAVFDIGAAAAGGMALRGAIEGAAPAIRAVRGRLDPNLPDKEFARAFSDLVPEELRTPEQEDALSIIARQAEIEEASPFVRTIEGDDAHFARLRVAMQELEQGRVPSPAQIASASVTPVVRAAARPGGVRQDWSQVKAAIRGPESGGNDRITNRAGSSAAGRYQFIEDTFVNLYRQEYRVSEAAAQRAWDGNRFDVAVQERLMDRLLNQNAAALERAGVAADQGNLYVAHFAGAQKAIELIQADPSLPVARFFSKTAVRQNPTYLGGGKTVGEALSIIRGKVGDPGEVTPVPVRDVPDLVRDPALDAERPAGALTPARTRVDDVGGELGEVLGPLIDIATNTRRSLNQVDALAEELGSTPSVVKAALDELVERGAITRNSKTGKVMRKAAAPVTAANTKRPRTLIEFLAERGGINDFGGDVRAMGLSASDKRLGKKVIRATERPEAGTGISGEGDFEIDSAFRAAREAGYFPELEGRSANDYGDLLDERALLLEAISDEIAGAVRYRMDDWDRLGEYGLKGSTEDLYGDPTVRNLEAANAAAERGAIEGFRKAWAEYGGDPADLDEELISRAAQIWQNDEAFVPEVALAMAVREEYEAVLRAAIDEGLEAEYGQAYDPFDPRIIDEYESRLAAELKRAGFGSVGPFDDAPAGKPGASRQGGESASPDRDGRPDADRRPNQRELDELAAAKPRSDHSDLPPDPDPRFEAVDGEGVRATSESLWHDIEAADPNIAARQRQEAQLRAEAPLRGENATGQAQDGEMGTPLFDAADQDKFDLGDGKGERPAAEIRAEIDTEKSGIEAMRSCLK